MVSHIHKSYVLFNHEMTRYDNISIWLSDDIRERHHFILDHYPEKPLNNPIEILGRNGIVGVVFFLRSGYPTQQQLKVCRHTLSSNRKAYFFWHREKAIEYISKERLDSYHRLRLALKIVGAHRAARISRLYTHNPYNPCNRFYRLRTMLFQCRKAMRIAGSYSRNLFLNSNIEEQGHQFSNAEASHHSASDIQLQNSDLHDLIEHARPLPFPLGRLDQSGYGAYVRLDFWAKISSGGSYGHTSYVAKELSRKTSQFRCFMAHRYSLIDEMGVQQSVLPEPGPHGNEETISNATTHYYPLLLAEFKKNRPSYIYERICLGNWVSAKLSQELGIPYIVEYNGSEISMKKSFDGGGYEYEDFYLDCEMAAFKQATVISVVSDIIKDDLVKRGIDSGKILVNPNGVDTDVYKPDDELKKNIRKDLKWSDEHRVIGFTGTFGGWHGIDILAESLPQIVAGSPEARFLLIGDGNLKHLVDTVIEKHSLADRVYCAGRVSQKEGARLLAACDIYVSPHNSHMVDSRFFGSPTKIFEYMAMGGGIVSTDLEQIGVVLSPAMRTARIKSDSHNNLDNARSILCEPGNIEEFVSATTFLVKHPSVCANLGKNARMAAIEHFSWEKHVQRLLQFLVNRKEKNSLSRPSDEETKLHRDSFYRTQARKQWDNDPCGSHYVKNCRSNTLEWFEAAERYRYKEYAPWMHKLMEFDKHKGELLLEIGGGMGTDLAQYAKNGARIVDFDLAEGHLRLAKTNFQKRGLDGIFLQGDAERLPFNDNSFDMVYSNGVLHHIPNMHRVVQEIFRVLKPNGRAIVMVYAENSKHYWENIIYGEGVKKGLIHKYSVGEIMSRAVEISDEKNTAKPLVKVYTRDRLRSMFHDFEDIRIHQCQITRPELAGSRLIPKLLKNMPLSWAEKMMGWNLVIKARKPSSNHA